MFWVSGDRPMARIGSAFTHLLGPYKKSPKLLVRRPPAGHPDYTLFAAFTTSHGALSDISLYQSEPFRTSCFVHKAQREKVEEVYIWKRYASLLEAVRERGIIDYIIRVTSEKGKECVIPVSKDFGLPSGRRGQGITTNLSRKKMGNGDVNRENSNPWQTPNRPNQEKEEGMRLWGIFLFGLIGATATTFAVSLFPGSLSPFISISDDISLTYPSV